LNKKGKVILILQKSARFLMIFLCAIMFHGNVFGDENSLCHKASHTIGYGMSVGLGCGLCGSGQYAILNDGSFSDYYVDYYVCVPGSCSADGSCILDGGEGQDCVETDDTYSRGEDGHCVENNICASADGSCLTDGCGMVGTQCQQCSGETPYSLKINGVSVSYNICVPNIAEENSDAAKCDENNKGCVCKSGFGAQDYAAATMFTTEQPGGCYACGENYITIDNACVECKGGQVANHVSDTCDCPRNQTFDDEKQKCVCMSGMGLNENNECETLGDGQIINSEGYLDKCDFGSVPNPDKNLCEPCDSKHVANENQTKCVKTCQGQGYGKYTENTHSQCVKCTDYGKFEVNGVCKDGCGQYQVNENGTCKYCDEFYDVDASTCVDNCLDKYGDNNQTVLTKRAYNYTVENIKICVRCNPYQDMVDGNCKSCASNQWFDSSEPQGSRCKSCPKNFACNGTTKKRCPFGTLSDENVGVCKGLKINNNNANKGFLYDIDNTAVNKVVSESDYDNYDVERFFYAQCINVNGYAESYADSESYKQIHGEENTRYENYKQMLQRDYSEYYAEGNNASVDFSNIVSSARDIRVCHQCKDTERANVSGVCLCGQKTNPNAGLIKDIVPERHGEICQVCPLNNVKKGQQDESYTCNPCSDNKGFLWDTSTNTFVCATCSGDTALYTDSTDSNGMKWCLTYDELKSALPKNDEYYVADTYYQENNVWTNCPAGSCCLGGKKYSCKKGTVSLANMVCENGTPGKCVGCVGKTTEREGTSCDGLTIDTCKSNMCIVSIVPTTFCIGTNSVEGMCFEIEKIKMSLKEGVGVFNTIDITKTDSGQ
jgi:hypothetical protein